MLSMRPTSLFAPKWLFLLNILWLIPTVTQALSDDRMEPAHLTANKARYDAQKHQGHYEGDVAFDQGSTHLRAIKLVTAGDEKNPILSATAFGTAENPAHYWEDVQAGKPPVHAYAKKIHYDEQRHTITLIGNAALTQGEDNLKAPMIRYDTIKKLLITRSLNQGVTAMSFHGTPKP